MIRPDSGDPPTVLASGHPSVLEILAEKFGYTTNAKGYKVLDPHVRIIQGDAVDFAMLDAILYAMQKAGFSADNIAFGSGGGLLQKLEPRTLRSSPSMPRPWSSTSGSGTFSRAPSPTAGSARRAGG